MIFFPTLINVGAAITLWLLPLSRDIDFEFAQFYGLMSFWTSCSVAWACVRKWNSPALAWKVNFTSVGGVLVVTMVLLVICGCSFERGITFFVLLVLPMTLSGTGVGLFCGRENFRWVWLTGWSVGSLAVVAIELWFRVPIAVHSAIWGYFHGPLYDEAVPITSELVAMQFGTAIFGVTLAALSSRPSKIRHTAAIAVFFLPTALRSTINEADGYSELKTKLSSHHRNGPIHIYLDPRLDSMGTELLHYSSFAYDRVYTGLNVTSKPDVDIFVFHDAEQKKKIFGAGETHFAKIWRNEIFVNAANARDVIRHEIVHIIASQEGWPIWRTGLLEGLAVAVEWNEPYFTPHEWAGALLRLGRNPSLREWFTGTGFFAYHGRMSYILSGSFVRFLIDTYGVDKVKKVYSGETFEDVYGHSIDSLDRQWRTFLDRIPISQNEVDWAGILLQQGIFGKKCVHAIAALESAADHFVDAGDWERSQNAYMKALSLDPDRIDVAVALARSWLMSGEIRSARDIVDKWLGKDVYASRRAELLILRGDLWLLDGASDSAALAWEKCLSQFGRIPSVYIACHLRLSGATSRTHWRDLEKIVTAKSPMEKIAVLDRVMERSPELKLPRYWKGTMLFAAGDFAGAVRVLADSATAFRDSTFELHRRLLIVESLLRLQRTEEANLWLNGIAGLCRRQVDVNAVRELQAYTGWLNRRREWD